MREFIGCKETITDLSKEDSSVISCVDGVVRDDSMQTIGQEVLRIDQIKYKTLSNGDVQTFFICNIDGGIEEIDTAIITQADNSLGVQLKSCNTLALREYDLHKVLGSVAALGKQYTDSGAFSGDLTQMSDELKEEALIDSLYWQCVSSRDDINEWKFGTYYPIFNKDDVVEVTDFSVTLLANTFEDYLEFVDYNGTIDDMVDNTDFKHRYGCSVSRSGDEITFSYDEDSDTVCTIQTVEKGYNLDGFELQDNGDLKVYCLLYDESKESSGMEYTAIIKFTDGEFGMQLESLIRES